MAGAARNVSLPRAGGTDRGPRQRSLPGLRAWLAAPLAELARQAPELASIDLVLAEALIAGAERTRFAEEAA